MNNSTSSIEKAFNHFQTAEHLFHKTLPIAKDPKLLLGIVKSISNSLEYAIESILSKEKVSAPEGLLKRINAVRPLITRYNFSIEDITFMLHIHEILYRQKQSPVEFKRGNTRVICSDDYDLEILSAKDIENFLQHTKKMLHNLNIFIKRESNKKPASF